jgi:hypothetical protein
MLLLRRENDNLSRRLDSALAEVAHSEEQRKEALEKYLQLIAAEDAAPKRKQQLMEEKFDLDREAQLLKQRERQLDQRTLELDRKEAELTRQLSRLQSRGISDYSPQPTHRSDAEQNQGVTPRTPHGAPKGVSHQGKAPLKLSPLTLRPPLVTPASLSHPQKHA